MKNLFAEQYFKHQIFLIWILLSCLLVFARWQQIAMFQMGDADDHLRIVQVRDWVAGQSWFDVTQYRINPPDGGPMHWSRLVDIPIAAVIVVLSPLFGEMVAAQIAATAVPLLTYGIVMWLIALVTRRLFDHKAALLAALTVFATIPAINQLLPMRIDHHGWQLVMFLVCLLALISSRRPIKSAIIMGIASALWLEISVEGLPFTVIFMGLLALRWIIPEDSGDRPDRGGQFPVAMLTLAFGMGSLFLVTEGFQFAENHCDALSPFHIAGIGAIALVINGAIWGGRLAGVNLNIAAKLFISAVAAMSGIAAILSIAPQCAGDAFGNLDPLVREYWFDRTPEGLPLWDVGLRSAFPSLVGLMVGLIGLTYVFRWKDNMSARDKLTLGILFLGTAIVGIYVSRAIVYALCIANILIAPAVLAIFRHSDSKNGLISRMALRIGGTILLIPTVIGPLIFGMLQPAPAKLDRAEIETKKDRYEKAVTCHRQSSIVALRELGRARLMIGLDISPSILQHTNLNVVATGHHRNQGPMKDVILTFTSEPEAARRILATRQIDYLVGCKSGSPELDYYISKAPAGFWAELQAGTTFDWLEPEPMIGPYQIWRVRRGAGE